MKFPERPGRLLLKLLSRTVTFIVGLVGTIAVLALWPSELSLSVLAPGSEQLGTGIFILLVVASLWSATAIHEAGHAAAAWLHGFRFEQIAVFPLVWWKPAHRTKAIMKAVPIISGGQVRVVPPAGLSNVRRALLWIVAAGPLASLVTIAAVVIPSLMPLPPEAAVFLVGIGGFSLLTVVLTLIPFRSQENNSDGKQLIDLWFKRVDGELNLAASLLTSQYEARFDGSALDSALIRTLIEQDQCGTARLRGHLFAAMKASHNEDMHALKTHLHELEEHFEKASAVVKSTTAWPVAVFAAICGDSDKARKYFALVPKASREDWFGDYMNGRLAMMEGKYGTAAKHLANMRLKLDSPIYSPLWREAAFRELGQMEAEAAARGQEAAFDEKQPLPEPG